MKTSPRLLIALAAAVLLGGGQAAFAQFDVNGPNAVLTLQGNDPSVVDPVDHDVTVPLPGLMDFRIGTVNNGGQGIILVTSPINPSTGSTLPTPWGGHIDLGTPGLSLPNNLSLVGDGVGLSVGALDPFFVSNQGSPLQGLPPEFVLTLAVGTQLDGLRLAFQAVVQDPTMSPPFDNTAAVDANFSTSQISIINPTTSAGIEVPFLPGQVFNFHGVSYTSVWVNSKGFLTFGSPTSAPSAGFTIDPVTQVGLEPGISIWTGDWENITAPDGVLYEELGNTVRVAWGDPMMSPAGVSHFGGSDVNRFQARLELQNQAFTNPLDGRFSLDYLAMDTGATAQLGDGFLGHTPGGGNLTAIPADIDLHIPATAFTGVAQIEEHNASGANASMLGYDGFGTPRAYNSMFSWDQQTVTFDPLVAASIPGDAGYTSTASGPAPDDARVVVPNNLALTGGQMVTIAGKFAGFNDSTGAGGSITFDPNGANLPGFVVGILDGTGTLQPNLPNNPAFSPFRNGEGLVVSTPPFTTAGPIDIRVDFNSGASFTVQGQVVIAGQMVTSYPLFDVSGPGGGATSAHHMLTNTIDFYGTTYTDIWIHLHGYVTFGSAAAEFSETVLELFQGWPQTATAAGVPLPGVAVMWSDLNNGNMAAQFNVIEDTIGNTTTIEFRNQRHWTTNNPAGDASVTFNALGPNSLTFDHSGLIAETNPGGNTHGLVIGFSNGDPMTGVDVDLTNGLGTGISNVLGTYLSPAGPESIGEFCAPGIQPALGVWSATDFGDGAAIPFGSWSLF